MHERTVAKFGKAEYLVESNLCLKMANLREGNDVKGRLMKPTKLVSWKALLAPQSDNHLLATVYLIYKCFIVSSPSMSSFCYTTAANLRRSELNLLRL